MNKKIMIMFASVIVVLVAALAGVTYAWLTDTGDVKQIYKVGDVEYVITGDKTSRIVVPGVNLFSDTSGSAPVTIQNASDVDTNLRVRVVVSSSTNTEIPTAPTYTIAEELETINTDLTNHILVKTTTGWVRDGALNIWYYGTLTGTGTGIIKEDDLKDEPTNLFDSLQLNGMVIGNNFTGITITITFIFEAKQADGVTWQELADLTIDFGTGLQRP